MAMMLRRPLVALFVVSLLGAACATEADDPVVSGKTTTTDADRGTSTTRGEADGFTPEPIVWDDCGEVDCATLAVPLDSASPTVS